MRLNSQQTFSLLRLAIATEKDGLDCSDCFHDVAAFAEAQLAEREIPEALQAVEIHLRQCPCCKDEYIALLDGLRELQLTDS